MVGMLLGNVINIILDPVFILGLDMGCAGAAVATSIGQIAAGVFFVVYILRGKTELSIRPKDFSAKDGIAKQVFAIGFPAAMITALMNIYTIITNAVMGHFGDLAVAAMGRCDEGSHHRFECFQWHRSGNSASYRLSGGQKRSKTFSGNGSFFYSICFDHQPCHIGSMLCRCKKRCEHLLDGNGIH